MEASGTAPPTIYTFEFVIWICNTNIEIVGPSI